ncbi:hypothetical protein PVAND_013598 [Polypedilum vanderplanki]|uniref:Secreted protein n=1 Tax=Polypedilum vanderplanki TaxID=319348 RepID=A0A9J6CS28_POLVA|nr:hypothetical protein PVAND_013598 [Polypedilum vanderplanki]
MKIFFFILFLLISIDKISAAARAQCGDHWCFYSHKSNNPRNDCFEPWCDNGFFGNLDKDYKYQSDNSKPDLGCWSPWCDNGVRRRSAKNLDTNFTDEEINIKIEECKKDKSQSLVECLDNSLGKNWPEFVHTINFDFDEAVKP